MSKENKHTPWKAEQHIKPVGLGWGIKSDGWFIAKDIGKEEAEHIVKCVNSHDELLEALEALRPIIAYLASTDGGDEDFDKVLGEAIIPANELVTAVLAKARGQS